MAASLRQPVDLLRASKRDLRTQFGALCWRKRKGNVETLLVTTRRTRRWVIPKGWPMDGRTPAETALQEAVEEAGIRGRALDRCIGIYTYAKEFEDAQDIPVAVAVFPVEVLGMRDEWPQKAERHRRWLSPKKASKLVVEPDLAQLLKGFSPNFAKG